MTLSLTASNSLSLSSVSTLFLPGSEITAFDPGLDRVWVTSGSGLRIVNFADPANPTLAATIDFTAPPYNFSNDVNSVAIKNGIVAIAVNAPVATNPGKVFLFTPMAASSPRSMSAPCPTMSCSRPMAPGSWSPTKANRTLKASQRR